MTASGIARKVWKSEEGQTLIFSAVCLTILMGVLALAVDIGMFFCAQQAAQTAADAGAIAAMREESFGDSTAAAQADAATNGFTNGTNGVTVAVNNPPLYGPYAGTSGYAEVIVTSSQSSYFLNVFNIPSMNVQARAVAALVPTNNCVYTLGTSGTDISMSNGANVDLPGCYIYDNSNSSSALSVIGGATLTDSGTNVVGGYAENNGGNIVTTPTTGVAPVSDPLAGLEPPSYNASSCTAETVFGGQAIPLPAAGCYSTLDVSYGSSTLAPGLYVITQSLTLGGGASLSGTGVTFYLGPNASLNVDAGGNTINLTAPTSGTYNGILFYQDRSNTTAESIEGGANSILNGILYFPDAGLTLENGSSTNISYATVISQTLTFAGGENLKNYALLNPETPISTPRLVE